MAFFASSNVTITMNNRDRYAIQKLRCAKANISFGDGSLAYCSGGVPLPGIGNFGFSKELKLMVIQQPHKPGEGSSYEVRYDQDNHKVVLLQPYSTPISGSAMAHPLVQLISGSTPTVNVDVMVYGE